MKEKKIIDDTVKRSNKTFDKSEELCAKMKEEYTKALENIQKEVADFYMKYAENSNITYTEAVRSLSKAGLSKYRKTIHEFKQYIDIDDVGLMAELDAAAAKIRISRLEGLMASIRLELAKLQAARQDGLEKHLEDTFKLNYEGAVAGIEDIIDIKSSFSMINPSLIRETISFPWSGRSFSEIIWNDTNKLAGELKSELVQGFIRGTSAHKMSSNLAKRMNNSYMNTQRVVMTESAHVLNKASLMAYMDNGVDKVEFLAVLDGKTSSVCFNLNGDEIPIKDAVPGKNIPPLHPHCRSTIIPVVDEGIDNNENSGKIEVENLLPNYQNALIPEEKLLDCYLNKQHPTGKDKAIAFEKALGYTKDNYKDLIQIIHEHLSKTTTVMKGKNKYGNKYECIMAITGPNGKKAKVKTGWIVRNEEDFPRLTAVYVDK